MNTTQFAILAVQSDNQVVPQPRRRPTPAVAPGAPSKVTASHLARAALLYVRQSTTRQVMENQESTRRQYGLRERATALGWQSAQIEVIDTDLGQSGASSADRLGFQHLVGEVAMGRAGIVLGLEVSRLARNSSDWHRLLELCALANTLILDEDGLYDPAQFNDRMLLGLKGTMSEAELHVLRARLRGGLLAKAARGELRIALPIGLAYDAVGRVVLDPDAQVQATMRLFFDTFVRTGSAGAVVKYFRDNGLKFPTLLRTSISNPTVLWSRLNTTRAVLILHSPRYAGAYSYGRARTRKRLQGGTHTEQLPIEQWHTLIFDAHVGYVSWEQFERNQRILATNATKVRYPSHTSVAREGPALLQGLVLCGKCGRRLVIRYQHRKYTQQNDVIYCCIIATANFRDPPCQTMPGATIDAAISEMVIAAMSPMALQISLAIQGELQDRQDQTDLVRDQQVQRAQYEVDLARRRYMAVDSANRLVACTLEAEWNNRLAELDQTRAEAERQRQADQARMSEQTREQILALSQDFAAVWHDPSTPDRERKRMLALLIEDVTLTRGERIVVQVRFRGGATSQFDLPVPLKAWAKRATHPEALALIRQWAKEVKSSEIAKRLNAVGHTAGAGAPFTASKVQYLIFAGRMGKTVVERVLSDGHLNCTQMANLLQKCLTSTKNLRQNGKLLAEQYPNGQWGYLPLAQQPEPIRRRAENVAKLAQLGQNADFIG